MSYGEYLGLKLTVVDHERFHGLKRALVSSDQLHCFRMQFGFGFSVQMQNAHPHFSLRGAVPSERQVVAEGDR